jgi:transposase InsO family protein
VAEGRTTSRTKVVDNAIVGFWGWIKANLAVAGQRKTTAYYWPDIQSVWSMDFVADQLVDGRRFRSLTVVDICTRECLATESEQRLIGEDALTCPPRTVPK